MSLLLRLDVDKPYGHHTLWRKIASKLVEETAIVPWKVGYLDHLMQVLTILKERHITAVLYFRECTIPSPNMLKAIRKAGHAVGWHAEDTRDETSFSIEISRAREKLGELHSFTKHGSGIRKLGLNHHAPYEEDKYHLWATKIGVPFYSGNGIATSAPIALNGFFPTAFWLESRYRSTTYNEIAKLVIDAQNQDLLILSHPENIVTDIRCLKDLETIADLAIAHGVSWRIP